MSLALIAQGTLGRDEHCGRTGACTLKASTVAAAHRASALAARRGWSGDGILAADLAGTQIEEMSREIGSDELSVVHTITRPLYVLPHSAGSC